MEGILVATSIALDKYSPISKDFCSWKVKSFLKWVEDLAAFFWNSSKPNQTKPTSGANRLGRPYEFVFSIELYHRQWSTPPLGATLYSGNIIPSNYRIYWSTTNMSILP